MCEKWQIEKISSENFVYRRVHFQKIDKKLKIPTPAAFKNTPEQDPELSTDWDKYATPQDSRNIIGKEYRFNTTEFKNPSHFFIIGLKVQDILDLNINHTVDHSPKQNEPEEPGSPNNRAHSCVVGDKTQEEIRLKLQGIAKWFIPPNDFSDPSKG